MLGRSYFRWNLIRSGQETQCTTATYGKTHLCAKTFRRKSLIFKGKLLATVSIRVIRTITPIRASMINRMAVLSMCSSLTKRTLGSWNKFRTFFPRTLARSLHTVDGKDILGEVDTDHRVAMDFPFRVE